MATAPRTFPSGVSPHGKKLASDAQLRRDRIKGIIVLAVVAALMALMIWLASIGNGGGNVNDFWPMMP